MGIAVVLEAARALSRTPTRRPLVFLIDDGEEQDLLGAEAFAERHPPEDFLADVNVEARGTTGTSFLFETSENNAWLAPLFRALPHPDASSLFYFVYKTLPNDTDLTVFRRHGYAGVNFGCIGGVSRYHTPRDDLLHLDPATLQHHGDNVVALARALDARPDDAIGRGDAVYFDVFAAGMILWPERATLPAAIAIAVMLLAGITVVLRRGLMTASRYLLAIATVPAAVAGGSAGAAIVQSVLRRAGAIPSGWIAHPLPAAAACWAAAISASVALGGWVARRAGPRASEAGIATVWVLAAFVLAAKAPSASFLFLVPALPLAFALLVAGRRDGDDAKEPMAARASRIAASTAAGFFFLPVAAVLLDALGFRGMPAIGALLGLFTSVFAADIARTPRARAQTIAVGLIAASALAMGAALLVAPFTRDTPQRASILLDEDADSGQARWIIETDADSLPSSLRRAAPFRREREFPWYPDGRAFAVPARPPGLPAPLLHVSDDRTADGTRMIRAVLRSSRGASVIRIAFPPGSPLIRIAVGGRALAPLPEALVRRAGGWRSYTCVTTPEEGIAVEIAARAGPLDVVVADRSPGVPASAAFLLSSRPAEAVPSQSGDGVVVTRRIRL
jgi:hypothetical protein